MILFRKARRRHPGVYVFRTRRHLRRGTEFGYAGKSNSLALRRACHEGTCKRHPQCADGKPWADLIVSYHAFELPWWLGWQWITLSLETLVIFALRPRYNWQKNPRRSKVPPRIQMAQRAARDRARMLGTLGQLQARPSLNAVSVLVTLLASAMIVTGLAGWYLTR